MREKSHSDRVPSSAQHGELTGWANFDGARILRRVHGEAGNVAAAAVVKVRDDRKRKGSRHRFGSRRRWFDFDAFELAQLEPPRALRNPGGEQRGLVRITAEPEAAAVIQLKRGLGQQQALLGMSQVDAAPFQPAHDFVVVVPRIAAKERKLESPATAGGTVAGGRIATGAGKHRQHVGVEIHIYRNGRSVGRGRERGCQHCDGKRAGHGR